MNLVLKRRREQAINVTTPDGQRLAFRVLGGVWARLSIRALPAWHILRDELTDWPERVPGTKHFVSKRRVGESIVCIAPCGRRVIAEVVEMQKQPATGADELGKRPQILIGVRAPAEFRILRGELPGAVIVPPVPA